MRIPVLVAIALAPLAAAAQDFRAAIAAVDGAVGRVLADESRGTGFVIHRGADDEVLVLTNNHVVGAADTVVVGFGTPRGAAIFAGEVIGRSVEMDLALLSVWQIDGPRHRPTPLPIARRELQKAERVAALGFPGVSDRGARRLDDPDFLDTTFSEGAVSKVQQSSWTGGARRFEIVQHTAPTNAGNSGGPLIDACGQVVGVNTAKAARGRDGVTTHGTFWASSSNTVAAWLAARETPFRTEHSNCGSGGIGQSARPVRAVLLGSVAIVAATVGGTAVMRRRAARAVADRPGADTRHGPAAGRAAIELTVRDADGVTRSLPISLSDARDGVLIGRGAKAAIVLDDALSSREHARLRLADRRLTIADLGSHNGTRVDGRRLSPNEAMQINSASRIEIGGHVLSVRPAGRQG